MDRIIKELKDDYEKNKAISNEDEEKELEFLTSFLNKTILTNINSIMNMDRRDFLLAVLSCFNLQGTTFSELQEKVSKLVNFNSISNADTFFQIAKTIFYFRDNELMDNLSIIPAESLKANNGDEDLRINSKILGSKKEDSNLDFDLKRFSIALSQEICKTQEETDIFLELAKNYTNEMLTALIGIVSILTAKEDFKELKCNCSTQKVIENTTWDSFKKTNLLPTLKLIEDRKNKLNLRKKESFSLENRRKKRLDTIIGELKKQQNLKTIKISPTLFALIENEDIKFSLLKHVLLHNRDQYQETKKKLVAEETLSSLEKIFKSNGLDFNILADKEKELLTSFGDIDSIEKILNILKDKKFKFLMDNEFSITEILLLATPTTVSTIDGLLTQGLLDESFIKNNPDIFYDDIDSNLAQKLNKDKGRYSTLLQNLNCLRNKKINVKKVSITNPKILINDNNILLNNLEKLDAYDLNFQKAKRFDLIENDKLIPYLDIFIELGLYDYIKCHPDIINSNAMNIINRILFCKQLDIEIFDGNRLNDLVTANVFKIGKTIIDDISIAQCINNQTFFYANEEIFKILLESVPSNTVENEEIPNLLPWKKTEQIYDFDGVLISRNKVLRNYNILKGYEEFSPEEIIFNSLTFGSILDIEEQNKISNAIFNSQGINKVKK